MAICDYTIPRTTRELQRGFYECSLHRHYTIPRTTRELQHLIVYNLRCRALYHTKNYQGTTTSRRSRCSRCGIIPYQELPGNYNPDEQYMNVDRIIPYQELPGNYNAECYLGFRPSIIPYQELPGNYNTALMRHTLPVYYTIPRTTRELQPFSIPPPNFENYTIPRTTRELQQDR